MKIKNTKKENIKINNNAIVLCSGGLDSVVTLNYAKNELRYKKIIVLFFNYNQRTIKQERFFSKFWAKRLGVRFIEVKLDFLSMISTSLINTNDRMQKRSHIRKVTRNDLKNSKKESDKYYVPMRNSIFIINALALAEALYLKKKEVYDIITGFKSEGSEGYKDTSPKYVNEFNKLIKISSNLQSKLIAPLIKKDKEDIIRLGKELGVNFKFTYSCYKGVKASLGSRLGSGFGYGFSGGIGTGMGFNKNYLLHCGTCLACRLRQEGFYWANIIDSTPYKELMKDFRLAERKK